MSWDSGRGMDCQGLVCSECGVRDRHELWLNDCGVVWLLVSDRRWTSDGAHVVVFVVDAQHARAVVLVEGMIVRRAQLMSI